MNELPVVTGILLAHPCAFGSGELKRGCSGVFSQHWIKEGWKGYNKNSYHSGIRIYFWVFFLQIKSSGKEMNDIQ